MKRRKIKNVKKDKIKFSKTGSMMNSKNNVTIQRGGIRF